MRLKGLLLAALAAGLMAFALVPQWRSFDRMGERRFKTLNHLPSEIRIGVCWPFAVNQDGMRDGLELARDEINAGGLAAGLPIRLVMRDDQDDWERAKRIAVEFSNDSDMSAMLGYYDDSQAVKASMMYESSRLLHLIVGANNTAMTGRGLKYIVRTVLSSDKIARNLAQLSIERGRRKVAVIWEEDAYGEDLAYQYRVALDALGGQMVYQWSYSRERADFRLPVNQLKRIDADMIFFAGLEPWAGDFVRMLREARVKTEFMGAFSDTPEMRAHAGPGLEGAMYFDFYNVGSPSPQNQAFVSKFHQRYGRNPDTWAAQGYDALQLLAKAVDATRSANPLDLSDAMRYMEPWEGANGLYKFNGTGEMDDKPLFLNVYRNGTPVIIRESLPVPASLVQ